MFQTEAYAIFLADEGMIDGPDAREAFEDMITDAQLSARGM